MEFQYNDKKYAATGKTPFELNFGRHPWKGDLMVKMDIPQVEDFLSDTKKLGTGDKSDRRSTEKHEEAF